MRYIGCLLFTIMLFMPFHAKAENPIVIGEFESLPILFDGRLMPLDSLSNILVARLSNNKYKGEKNKFLASSLFDPATTIQKPIFYIKDNNILVLKEKTDFLYSYYEVDIAFQEKIDLVEQIVTKPRSTLSLEQEQTLQLYENYILYGQILRAMTGLMPIALHDQQVSYYKLIKNNYDFSKAENLIRESEENFSRFNESDQKLIDNFFKIQIIKKSADNNQIFRVIYDEDTAYKAPWLYLREKTSDPSINEQLSLWEKLVAAYIANNQALWNEAAESLSKNITNRVYAEKIYNDLSLTLYSTILFSLSIICVIIFLMIKKNIFIKANAYIFSIATSFLVIDIFLRIFISARPPIGTLYESILFATAVLAICFLFFRKQSTFILAGAIACFILMLSAKAFVGDDSFSPLVAVLNTNFWLATHVIVITAGYGFCIITSLLGHLALFKPHKNWKRLLTHFGVASLLLVTIGTILGGLWADQSWGRFWGWDPKENGALLIILWLIWMVHAKMTDYIDDTIYYAGMAYLSIIVALAWFGVNLLSVGLHSYGFVSGIAFGLTSFCVAQTIIIGFLFYRQKKLS